MIFFFFFFLPAAKRKHFIPVASTALGVLARHAQIIQNKLRVSLQYIKENEKDEVEF